MYIIKPNYSKGRENTLHMCLMSSLYFGCNKTAEAYPKTDTCAFLTLWLLYVLLQGNSVEMSMWLPKKMQLLGWSESLKRSGTELPADFDQRLTALRSKWDQLEVGLSLFSLLYEHAFSNAEKELQNIRVLFGKSLLKAQSITHQSGVPLWKERASWTVGSQSQRCSDTGECHTLRLISPWSRAPCRDERKRAGWEDLEEKETLRMQEKLGKALSE